MNDIKLLKNNDNRQCDDVEWVQEFYNFLTGHVPKTMELGHSAIKLSPTKAFSIIYYLQEHFPIIPDTIEKCSLCHTIYDSDNTGFHSEKNQKFYCGSCSDQAPDE